MRCFEASPKEKHTSICSSSSLLAIGSTMPGSTIPTPEALLFFRLTSRGPAFQFGKASATAAIETAHQKIAAPVSGGSHQGMGIATRGLYAYMTEMTYMQKNKRTANQGTQSQVSEIIKTSNGWSWVQTTWWNLKESLIKSTASVMRHKLPKISIPDTDDNPPWHCPLHSRWIDVHLKCHGQRWVFILYMVWKIGFDLVYQNTLKKGGWTFPNPYVQVNLWGLPFIPVAFLHRHGIVQASTSEAFQVLQSLQLCWPKLGPKSMYQVFSKKIQNFIGTFGFWHLKSLKTKR